MASAKKRVEMAMASKAKLQTTTMTGAPHVQINTHVDDPQKSLEELFTEGMRTHGKHFERKKVFSISFVIVILRKRSHSDNHKST